MVNTDGRRLTYSQLAELRRRGVAAVQRGESPEDVARTLGVNRSPIYGWLALHRSGGWDRLDAKKRGGRRPLLDAKALKWIYKTVTDGDPRQFKFKYGLWTSKMIGKVINKQFGIKPSKASVCRLLNQLGLSAQRPLWRAYQRDPEFVDKWLEDVFPQIQARAKRKRATIWFADETGVRSDAHSGTTWSERGKTPVVSSTGARFGLNLISAVNRRGGFRFMCIDGRLNAGVFIEFLRRLLHHAEKPIFLIVDGHPAHKAKKVREFVESVSPRLELHFLAPATRYASG